MPRLRKSRSRSKKSDPRSKKSDPRSKKRGKVKKKWSKVKKKTCPIILSRQIHYIHYIYESIQSIHVMFALPAAWLAQSDQKGSDTWTSWTLSCWRQICIGTLLQGGHPETKSTETSDSSSVQCNLLQPLRLSGQNPCFDFICILTRTVYLVHLGQGFSCWTR